MTSTISKSLSPNIDLPNNTAKDYVILKPPTHHEKHRYPTRSTVAKAANSMQMEQSYINNPALVTYNFIQHIIEPPDQLKYQDLIKGNDRKV